MNYVQIQRSDGQPRIVFVVIGVRGQRLGLGRFAVNQKAWREAPGRGAHRDRFALQVEHAQVRRAASRKTDLIVFGRPKRIIPRVQPFQPGQREPAIGLLQLRGMLRSPGSNFLLPLRGLRRKWGSHFWLPANDCKDQKRRHERSQQRGYGLLLQRSDSHRVRWLRNFPKTLLCPSVRTTGILSGTPRHAWALPPYKNLAWYPSPCAPINRAAWPMTAPQWP